MLIQCLAAELRKAWSCADIGARKRQTAFQTFERRFRKRGSCGGWSWPQSAASLNCIFPVLLGEFSRVGNVFYGRF